tara:strand:+ start:251 stop:2677 length:2427 start_codon:yes stop_codon:yes gene_type:complete
MAIDYNAGINSIDVGAHDITYSGNQGPKSPDQERQMAFDDTPGFELQPLELLLEEFREDNNGQDPTSIDDLRKFFYNKYGPKGIAQVEQAVQQQEQQAQQAQQAQMQEGREGIQMASAADPMLEEEYEKYVFEMEEQGLEPMSFEQFRQEAVAGMATGGRVALATGRWADPGMSPGQSRSQGPAGGQTMGGGGGYSDKERFERRQPDPRPDTSDDRFKQYAENIVNIPPPKPDPKDPDPPKTFKEKRKRELEKAKIIARFKKIKPRGTWSQKTLFNLLPKSDMGYQYLETLEEENPELFAMLPEELKNLVGQSQPASKNALTYDQWSMLTQVPGYGEFLKERGKPGVLHGGDVGRLGDRYVKYTGELDEFGKKIKATDKYGNVLYGYHEPTGDNEGQMREFQKSGYPSYESWLASQNQSGGGGETTPPEEDPVIPTDPVTTAALTNQYYIPGASNFYSNLASTLPTGQTTGTTFDPTSEMLKYYMADGGRAGYASGGITGLRQGYFLGKLVKKIGKTIGKVAKSPLGKTALMAGLGSIPFGASNASLFSRMGGMFTGGDSMFGKALGSMKGNPLPWILGASAAGGLYTKMTEDDEDENELYKKWLAEKQAADAYWTPRFSAAFPAADGGRIGYKFGKSVDNMGIEDIGLEQQVKARMEVFNEDYNTALQKVLEAKGMSTDSIISGTEVMEPSDLGMNIIKDTGVIPKIASLPTNFLTNKMKKLSYAPKIINEGGDFKPGFRPQYSVHADGGRTGYDNGGSASDRYEVKIKELMDKGLSRELAEALVLSELSPDAYNFRQKRWWKNWVC